MKEVKKLEDLVGLTIVKIEQLDKTPWEGDGDALIFHLEDGRRVRMLHEQDCCEGVYLEDVVGDLDDLVGSPLLQCEEVSGEEVGVDETKPVEDRDWGDESFTWTFYKMATIKGSVTIRWYGESNGYYSERVDVRIQNTKGQRWKDIN